MRKFNAILTALILVLFLVHSIFGSMQMVGIGTTALKRLARGTVLLILIHTVIGVKLSIDTIHLSRKAGTHYFRENLLFWARRISGLVILILIVFHMTAFTDGSVEIYRLKEFDQLKLVLNLLLVISVAIHVLMNVKPLLISFGLKGLRNYTADIWIVLAIVLLVLAAAFIIYFLRWQAL